MITIELSHPRVITLKNVHVYCMPHCTVASDSTVMTVEKFECGASVTECKTGVQ